jgi:hypothetical protein
MGKAKVRFDSFAPTASADAAIDGRTSSNTNSAKRPVNKVRGSNAKLDDIITTSSFDGSKYLDLSSAEEFAYGEAWVWVFAFVDLNSTTDCILAYTSDNGGYVGIEAGGAGIVYRPNSSKASEITIATGSTSTEFVGELIDARFYNGSDCPPITTASLQAIGNRYKQYMN